MVVAASVGNNHNCTSVSILVLVLVLTLILVLVVVKGSLKVCLFVPPNHLARRVTVPLWTLHSNSLA